MLIPRQQQDEKNRRDYHVEELSVLLVTCDCAQYGSGKISVLKCSVQSQSNQTAVDELRHCENQLEWDPSGAGLNTSETLDQAEPETSPHSHHHDQNVRDVDELVEFVQND
jgi:hypothetical protein